MRLSLAVVPIVAALCAILSGADLQVSRRDFYVESDPGVKIYVREVTGLTLQHDDKVPIVLVHGARVPGVASFDLDVPGGSLAHDLAKAGHSVYILDLRGYGNSTRPEEMNEPPESNNPLVRSAEAVRDIGVVVSEIQKKKKIQKVALLGWATGGHWCGHYASIYQNTVSHLILNNSLYGAARGHARLGPGSNMEDPEHPGRFHISEYKAYRFNTADSLIPSWDESIPIEDKTKWRDPRIVEAYQKAALASDPESSKRNPPSFRAPSGALEDSFYLASGRQLWDASLILAKTLIVRSERDFWSRPEDVTDLQSHLVHAAIVQTLIIPNATHFVHLDRPEHGRATFLSGILKFLEK